MTSTSVLVLDSFPQTLAVVRSLSAAGYRVILGKSGQESKSAAEWSRHCHEVWQHPSYGDRPNFDHALRDLLDRRPEIRAIFPVAEPGISAINTVSCLDHRMIDVAMVSRPLFEGCVDKFQGNELAHRAGLQVPESIVVTESESLQARAREIGYPLIIKSPNSEVRIHGRKAYIVKSDAELESKFSIWPINQGNLLVQQYIEGKLVSVDYVACKGVLVAYVEACIWRTDQFDGTGGGVEFESIPPAPDTLAAVTSFVSAHNYSGAGVIQLIRHQQTNELFFVENNPRLAACIIHSMECGPDFPLLTLEVIRVSTPPLPRFDCTDPCYRYNYRMYWMARDLDCWISNLPEFRQREMWDWLRLIVRSYRWSDGHVYWSWRDPLPALFVYVTLARKLLSRVWRAVINPGARLRL